MNPDENFKPEWNSNPEWDSGLNSFQTELHLIPDSCKQINGFLQNRYEFNPDWNSIRIHVNSPLVSFQVLHARTSLSKGLAGDSTESGRKIPVGWW